VPYIEYHALFVCSSKSQVRTDYRLWQIDELALVVHKAALHELMHSHDSKHLASFIDRCLRQADSASKQNVWMTCLLLDTPFYGLIWVRREGVGRLHFSCIHVHGMGREGVTPGRLQGSMQGSLGGGAS
jgi:hypothetical protein